MSSTSSGSWAHLLVSVAEVPHRGRHQATTLMLLSTELGRGVQGLEVSVARTSRLQHTPGKSTWTPSSGGYFVRGSQSQWSQQLKPVQARSPGDILLSSVSGHFQPVTKRHQFYLRHLPGVVNSYASLCPLGPHPPPHCGHHHLPAWSLPQWPAGLLCPVHIAAGMIFLVQESGLSPAKTFIAFPLPRLPPGPPFSPLSPNPCLPFSPTTHPDNWDLPCSLWPSGCCVCLPSL